MQNANFILAARTVGDDHLLILLIFNKKLDLARLL